jgi:hypothetical protein
MEKEWVHTEEDINEFQLIINDFFIAFVEESGAGKEGVTNYIHTLGSGHVAYYMRAHGNLYKLSQQGWESLNDRLSSPFSTTLNVEEIWCSQHRVGKILLKIYLYVFPEGASLDVRNSRATLPKCTIRKRLKLISHFTLSNFALMLLLLHLHQYKIDQLCHAL